MKFKPSRARPERDHALRALITEGNNGPGLDGAAWQDRVATAWRELHVERRRANGDPSLLGLVVDWEQLGSSGLLLPPVDADALGALPAFGANELASLDFLDATRIAWGLPRLHVGAGGVREVPVTALRSAGGTRVLKGTAESVVGALDADVLAVLAATQGPRADRTDRTDKEGGLELVFVERDNFGVKVLANRDLGDGVCALDVDLVGATVEPGRCLPLSPTAAGQLSGAFVVLDSASLVGIAERLLNIAVSTRKAGEGSGGGGARPEREARSRQDCEAGLAEIAMKLHLTRLLTHQAASSIDLPPAEFAGTAASAKLLALQLADQAMHECTQAIADEGGYAFNSLPAVRRLGERVARLAIAPSAQAALRQELGRAVAFGDFFGDDIRSRP
jgi:alkylation response protein AidB-like acyl-CoA dehydrogenase